MTRSSDHARDDSDADSNAPLLPPPASAPNDSSSSSKPSSSLLGTVRWFHPVLALFGIGLLWLAFFGQAYEDRVGGRNDPQWPTNVGYEGPTPTASHLSLLAGSEALAAATSYPSNYDRSPLNPPSSLVSQDFDILHYLGNLSPWRTVNHGLKGTAQVPEGCTVEQVQLLHRHGARYPTTGSGTQAFAKNVVGAEGFKASGNLTFLNNWAYKLGAEILTPFGREQLFNLGASFRTKYGHLLDPSQKPVFRTESQDRMLKSALNFAAGFFGIPFEDQYHQLITIEWPGFNNTLAPYMTCPNAGRADLAKTAYEKKSQWVTLYLADAVKRFQSQVAGVNLTPLDVFNMQLMCAYELVALGGSEFCPLFTEDEWKGFEYAHDIEFYEAYSYGQPAQAAMGKGWVQEWLARTLKQPLSEFNSTTNATYHSSRYFPLDQQLYVDATHDTVISSIITTLNFSSFARSGPLPADHIPANLSFVTSSISPFAANLHSQVLSCPSSPLVPQGKDARFVRWILNDGLVPLDNVPGCVTNDDGLCLLEAYTDALQGWLQNLDFGYDCLAPYAPPEVPITDGRPPHS